MRLIQSVRFTLGLVFAATMLVGALSVATTLRAVREQRHDALIVNLTGLQRALSQRLVAQLWTAERDADALSAVEIGDTAEEIDRIFGVLSDGGRLEYAGAMVELPAVRDTLYRRALLDAWTAWVPLRGSIGALPNVGLGWAGSDAGFDELRLQSDQLAARMDRAVRAYGERMEARRERLVWLQLSFLIVGGLTVAIGALLLYTQILVPVHALMAGVWRMERGALDQPVVVGVPNELGRLGAAFDAMRARIRAKLDAQDLLMHLSGEMLETLDPAALAATTAAAAERYQRSGADPREEAYFTAFLDRFAALARARAHEHQALRYSEAKFAGIVSIAAEAIISVDESQRIVLFNEGAERVFGYTRAEVLGHPLALLLPEGARAAHPAQVAGFGDSSDQAREMGSRNSILGRRKGGEEFPAEATISKLDLDGKRIYTAVLRDISGRRALEEQLRLSQRMAAVGTLTGGIAHHFNNVLTTMRGHCDLLLLQSAEGDPARDGLQEIRRGADRAAILTRQLMAFSRLQLRQPKVLDLNRVILEIEAVLRTIVGEACDLELELAPDLGRVRADAGQVEEILVNLVTNARDAIVGRGTVRIATRNESARRVPGTGCEGAAGAQRCVVLTVSDSGQGMEAATAERAFEPFFTTRERATAVGLGLSTVYGIVQQNGGAIDLSSAPGRGTTVEIFLAETTEAVADAPHAPRPSAPEAQGTILLAEDEESVRRLVQRILERGGFRVLAASNGAEALERLERDGGPVALVVTDVVMPIMSGPTLAREITLRHPAMPVLYISGHSKDEIGQEGELPSGTAFLQKPFSPDALMRVVRELIGSSTVEV